MDDRLIIQQMPPHLCATCKFIAKCNRFRGIVQALQKLESDVLDSWRMNLTTTLLIDECDLYKMDFDVMQEIIETNQFYDNGTDKGGEIDE